MRVLYVEDEKILADAVKHYLKHADKVLHLRRGKLS